jgi:hypothetical protein
LRAERARKDQIDDKKNSSDTSRHERILKISSLTVETNEAARIRPPRGPAASRP